MLLPGPAATDIPEPVRGEFAVLAMVLVPVYAALTAVVIVPAAYDLARRGWGVAGSMLALCAVGAAAGAVPMLYLGLREGDPEVVGSVATFGAPVGLFTALLWSACNTDLFGRRGTAPPQA